MLSLNQISWSLVFSVFRAGPKPKMPKKELNRTYESEESLLKKLSEENNVGLPGSLKNKYIVGRIIGDGKCLNMSNIIFVILFVFQVISL